MLSDVPASAAPVTLNWLSGGGKMGMLIRAMDWAKTPLGPIDTWPQSLRTTISLCLASNFPISIAWGPHRVQIYNDGYWPICGGKHPHSMGQDFKECWFSAWPAVGEAFERAAAGDTSFIENRRMFLDRNGYLEETFFTFSFSPIRDETGGVGGLFHPVTELTQQTLAERRLKVVRDLADCIVDAQSVSQACALITQTLAACDLDLPFVLLYLLNADGTRAKLSSSSGLVPGTAASPEVVDMLASNDSAWPLAEAARSGRITRVDEVDKQLGPLACGPYPESPHTALVLPISLAGLAYPFGFLVAGVSARRVLDEAYHTFYEMLKDTVTNALTNARAYEEERKRAELLAELDRAKTTFFSNVSHEFRTPLTLMLGPLERLLDSAYGVLTPTQHEELDVVHRNGLRLLKLVNTLLDFSRIEAGRIEASYEPLDLAACTTDLASVFRAAIERAGLRLRVECPPLPDAVYVDRDMWEKIVLNLLSNAIKFTFAGEITVSLDWCGDHVEFRVHDTGTGIPEHELPRIFERFHRVRDARSRTHEGTGIGLALVQELVHLHGGQITVASEVGIGTTFTITIPTGIAHLATDRVAAERRLASTAVQADAFVEEAMRWLPAESERNVDMATPALFLASLPRPLDPTTPRILVADDNADMRAYLLRLLSPNWRVETVADGEQALAVISTRRPDLVLTDVMMPGLDGLALLRTLRTDLRTATLPVILLSARAGEESRVEGLEAGADDYLVKPFAARELLARVEAHLKLARLRDEMQEALRDLNTTLEQRVAERTAALEQAHVDLRHEMVERQHMQETLFQQEKLAALGTLLANVAHELNNPLSVATIQLDNLQEETASDSWIDDLETLRHAVERCKSVVQSFLALVRQQPPTRSAVALHAVVGDVFALLGHGLEADDIIVECHLAENLPPLWADPHQLHHVVANLITNAHHALRQTAPPRQLRLTAAANADRSQVILEVSDTGPGIPDDLQRRIFDPFFTTKPQGVGSGLGLPLCRNIIEGHGGAIHIASQTGHGTTVRVTLPVAAAEVRSLETSPEPVALAQPQRGAILLIDDDPSLQKVLRRVLQRNGHDVIVAGNGQEGLAALEERSYDVILCDMRMPGLDGPGFYREIEHSYPSLLSQIIFLTGDVLSPEAEAFFAKVDCPRLVKPVKAQEVRQAIQQKLEAQ